jgi:maleylacetoacetate isomerase
LSDLTLYTYWRSTAAYRVRIALALKGLETTMIPVNLLMGHQRADDFVQTNPQRMVPVLEAHGVRLTQSLAILDYLEAIYPSPSLLPSHPLQAARVREIAQLIACDIHPLNVPRVTTYLTEHFGMNEAQKLAWMRHWMHEGLSALESLLAASQADGFCVGQSPTIADCCLIPLLYSARRFGVPLENFTHALRVEQHCENLDGFIRAKPERQSDAV